MPSEHDQHNINVIKGLIMDATRRANSGHPGGAMSSADFAYILFKEYLKFDPQDPDWPDRDRFVLSAGHESMLLYSLLRLVGYLNDDDLQSFRQYKSRTPGHPEHDLTPGVEATTGPLGQGFAMAGGLATAEQFLRGTWGEEITDHYTYVLASDGDIQEPVCLGSAALFGQWGLGRLIVYYDSNAIQLAGPTARCDCADKRRLFESLCWQVIEIDGHDHEQIRTALDQARAETTRPTLIIGHTTIAKGSASLEGSADTHGAPFSEEEIAQTKVKLGLSSELFAIPQETEDAFRDRFPLLRQTADDWRLRLQQRQQNDPAFAQAWERQHRPVLPAEITWPEFETGSKVATRKAFGKCLESLIEQLPHLVGGSADLDPSNQTATWREKVGIFGNQNPAGRNLCFGVREFPMGAVVNGLALHGGVVPFGATFLVFSDYERNALRMSALQKLPALHIFTHDSFHVGEDGPTHQPVEHVSSLRLIPNLLVFRPADANESRACMELALQQKDRPSALLFTRQGVPVLPAAQTPELQEGVGRGAYIVQEAQDGAPDMIFMATGSEVHLALEAAQQVDPGRIRVVSMPCLELFEEQPLEYQEQILPASVTRRVAIEAGRTDMWYKYTGRYGLVIGLDHFGDSAPAGDLVEAYGFTPEAVAKSVRRHFAS
ncbi:transketolase [Desulfohalobium retbaense]|uniref:Transketolase n=1 Tax=Desulfohalobium retbaense (strain ATCC 49708 / DSM 5692 / JCM 16813 / HR100) TaxID=485915 RepID=C8X145_DESRD|nr:transketolase [Desulfohalobium retbaense]ACV68142.1 transketolase [Desulfohalobium retbaense DSM 5692]